VPRLGRFHHAGDDQKEARRVLGGPAAGDEHEEARRVSRSSAMPPATMTRVAGGSSTKRL
jgi:hypothetical protein